MSLAPFHLAIAVHDLPLAEHFYCETLGCTTGRRSEQWIDFDLYGHQLVCHATAAGPQEFPTNEVDDEHVPVPHFGVVLEWRNWEQLAERLRARQVHFLIEPGVRFAGQPGEQATMFLADPSGNMLEFKAMRNPADLFRAE